MYKFDDYPVIYVDTTQFMVRNYLSSLTLKVKVDPEKLKSLPEQVKYMLVDWNNVKSNQNYMYCKVHKLIVTLDILHLQDPEAI